MVVQRLTENGRDTLPVLMQLTAFGSKWYADVVFEDKRPGIYIRFSLNQKR
ncbi:MAG TPA: hypothetical protein VE544_01520 [Nitrososphaeraceae archaeon]|nr:hypothetical protein [Nitrososphaeraceae archaeon]